MTARRQILFGDNFLALYRDKLKKCFKWVIDESYQDRRFISLKKGFL